MVADIKVLKYLIISLIVCIDYEKTMGSSIQGPYQAGREVGDIRRSELSEIFFCKVE